MRLSHNDNKEFIREITEIILTNLGNENFGVRELVQISGMHQSTLNKKLRTFKHTSISRFIREVRLQKALEMLQNESVTASEVAYRVGFSSPDYFNRCFHEYFGYPPGKIKRLRTVNPEEAVQPGVIPEQNHESPSLPVLKYRRPRILILSVLILAIAAIAYVKILNGYNSGNLRSPDGRISLVVLPFQNLSNDTLYNVWQSGIQTMLLTTLSNSGELKVRQIETINGYLQGIGITETASLKPSLAGKISRKLDARVYIWGSINKAGPTLRINAQMVNSGTGENIKSFTIDGTEADIFRMTDSLSAGIMNSLSLFEMKKKLTAGFPDQYVSSTESPEAYQYFICGQTAYYKDDFPTAVEWFLKALAVDSNLVGALMKISNAYYNENRIADSKEWCLRYYRKKDKMTMNQKLWAEVMYSYNFKTITESIKYLKLLIETDDMQPITYFQLGDAYLFTDQYEKAIVEFQKALEIFRKWDTKPFWVSFYCELGIAYHKAGLYGEEKKLYRKAEKDFPDNPGIMDQQAWLYLTLGDTATANRYIKKWISVRKDESWPEAKINSYLAYIYSMAGMPEKEAEFCRKALYFEPDNVNRMSILAYILTERNINPAEGMELAEKVLKTNPDNFLSIQCLGLGLYRQGKFRDALPLLQKSWDLRMERSVYDHQAFLQLEEAKKAAVRMN